MASFAARALRSLRDPWSLVVAGIGAGSAWAIGLPVGAAGLVGAGMLGVAAVVGGAVRKEDQPPPAQLRRGTVQHDMLQTLQGYRADLGRLASGPQSPAVGVTAREAGEAAVEAERVARNVALAVDAVDDALVKAQAVARQLPGSADVQATVQRIGGRREQLLTKLHDAVGEVGELYARLLELSTTAGLVGMETDAGSRAADVNDSLDAIRLVFAELETDASRTRAML
ncbi:hypothetical protein [Nakamurella multipartita]|jgi:hypothetical protein|uniref:Uncharacterized protein n=1 Tax=Nakamurella multipartita (strain ATCC 700099 / DSM 44233 / CIP 104796 / JCM 9543 / NBRC 105858 / Y-104) TaxID=479431 RepID=C8XH17_NAKMY|nr:hypothetical protein [Nakamurella multipartita]ACV80248.1 hypothetical protein Namu_3956 [Nakamurella multipartita DSM 44233]